MIALLLLQVLCASFKFIQFLFCAKNLTLSFLGLKIKLGQKTLCAYSYKKSGSSFRENSASGHIFCSRRRGQGLFLIPTHHNTSFQTMGGPEYDSSSGNEIQSLHPDHRGDRFCQRDGESHLSNEIRAEPLE